MNLRELIDLDLESLSPAQAVFVCRDIREAMLDHMILAADKAPLQSLLIDAQRKASPPAETDIRTDVANRIREAKAEGNTRLAKALAEALVESDFRRAVDEERQAQAKEQNERYWAEQEKQEAEERERLTVERINARTQELVYSLGWTKSEAECRKIAEQEVRGPNWSEDAS